MNALAGVRRVEAPGSVPRPRLGPQRARPHSIQWCGAQAVLTGQPAPSQLPRPVAGGLSALLCDDAPAPTAGRPLAAARAFAQGNSFLPGQMVDRAL